jgi:hypothetical protein
LVSEGPWTFKFLRRGLLMVVPPVHMADTSTWHTTEVGARIWSKLKSGRSLIANKWRDTLNMCFCLPLSDMGDNSYSIMHPEAKLRKTCAICDQFYKLGTTHTPSGHTADKLPEGETHRRVASALSPNGSLTYHPVFPQAFLWHYDHLRVLYISEGLVWGCKASSGREEDGCMGHANHEHI